MVRNLIRNQAPGNRLRVRIPCPPLQKPCFSHTETARLRDPWDFCGLGAIRYLLGTRCSVCRTWVDRR